MTYRDVPSEAFCSWSEQHPTRPPPCVGDSGGKRTATTCILVTEPGLPTRLLQFNRTPNARPALSRRTTVVATVGTESSSLEPRPLRVKTREEGGGSDSAGWLAFQRRAKKPSGVIKPWWPTVPWGDGFPRSHALRFVRRRGGRAVFVVLVITENSLISVSVRDGNVDVTFLRNEQ